MSAHISIRQRAMRPSISRALLAFVATAFVTGVGCLLATATATGVGRTLLAACLGTAAILLSVAVAIATYYEQEARPLRDYVAVKEASFASLADEAVPAVVRRVREGASIDTALAAAPQPADGAQRRILWAVAREVGLGERRRAAAMSACANAAGRVQALATSMLADLREMEERHDEEVFGDLLKLDHGTAQAGRLADSIAVLSGARSGRRWTKPIVMESILRGAVGRIGAYQRVRLHSTLNVAVVGYAAEGVMHALAELMDNAAKFSPPSEQVHVYAEDVQAGVVITIEDSGLTMSDSALRRAERAVSPEPLDLANLSGTRLGLAVVGCLARKHRLTVSFRPSSRGGTGVVVMIPRMLITESQEGFSPAARAVLQSASATASRTGDASAGTSAHASAKTAEQAHGLPKRRRGETFTAVAPASRSTSAATSATSPSAATGMTPAQPRPDAGSRFSAFREADRRGEADRADRDGTEGDGGSPPAAADDDIG